MAIFKKNTKTKETQSPQQHMEKLLVFISIVNRGQGSYVLKLMETKELMLNSYKEAKERPKKK